MINVWLCKIIKNFRAGKDLTQYYHQQRNSVTQMLINHLKQRPLLCLRITVTGKKMFETSRPWAFMALFLRDSNVFINHSTAPTAKKEHFGPGAQGPARPPRPTSGQLDPPAWSTGPSSEPREASPRPRPPKPRGYPGALNFKCPGPAGAQGSHPRSPSHRHRLHIPSARIQED